jgi:hypothetical protein
MDRHELAWAAGFFDGEGWANAVAQTGRRTRQPHAQINQSDDYDVPAVLERFLSAVGSEGSAARSASRIGSIATGGLPRADQTSVVWRSFSILGSAM